MWQVEGSDKVHELPAVKPIVVSFEGVNGKVVVSIDSENMVCVVDERWTGYTDEKGVRH